MIEDQSLGNILITKKGFSRLPITGEVKSIITSLSNRYRKWARVQNSIGKRI